MVLFKTKVTNGMSINYNLAYRAKKHNLLSKTETETNTRSRPKYNSLKGNV